MRLLSFFAGALTLVIFFSCGASNSKGTVLVGSIEDAKEMQVFLDKVTLKNTTSVLEQTTTSGSGDFQFTFEEKLPPAIYRLRIGAQNLMFTLDGTESKVTFNGDLASFKSYETGIEGSASASEYVETMSKLRSRQMNIEELQDFLKTAGNPMNAMQIAIMGFQARPDFAELHKGVSERMSATYPTSEYTKDYAALVTQLEQASARQNAKNKIQVGMPAPDITMEGPDGETYSLSDLKGKVVLLDFWASWCRPCRQANPHVVEIYHKYKEKGFTVFSVSLDGLDARTKQRLGNDPEKIETHLERSKQRWLDAIEKDGLEWDYHVSELSKWDTRAAREYGVSGIPRTYLIDREGKIAAINPRYNLEEALTGIL